MKNFFSNTVLLTLAILLCPVFWGGALAQNIGDYRTNGAVTFASATNWQRYNGTAWVAATNAPTSADGKILISGPNTAQVTSNVTLDQILVDGILQVNNGATLTLADGTGDDLFVRNRLFFEETGVIAGAGKLVLGNQAIVQTANVNGVSGSIASINPTLTRGASYWFDGTAAQSTGFAGFTNLGNPLHFHFKNTEGITIDRNLTIIGTLTSNNDVPITIGAGVTNFTANAIYNGGSFNNCVGAAITPAFTNANWASPKGVYQSPDNSEPTTESSNIWTNSDKTTAHIYWLKSGSGNNRIVVLKAGSLVNPNAVIDNTTYTANTVFGSGAAIDDGFVVYNGAGSQVDITGLTEGTTYHVAVFEYNQDCSGNRNYKAGSPLTTSFKAEERPFITEWITNDGTLTILTFPTETYNYTVSYRQLPSGIPTVLTGQTGNCTLLGLNSGVRYEISITGNFPRIGSPYFSSYPYYQSKIHNIKQWGSIKWTSMEEAFRHCTNLNSNATDVPNLSGVKNMNSMFAECNLFNGGNIANWNMQNVLSIEQMFAAARSFNQPIGNWNTQNVTTMGEMFSIATAFNQPIGNWNTQNVTDITGLFSYVPVFNQPIGDWNTQNVTDMASIFSYVPLFNQPIGNWNTQKVTDMQRMFVGASNFNQPIGTWHTQNVTNMYQMFCVAAAFNQPIGNWHTQNVTNMEDMFSDATTFNQPIGSWNTQNVTDMQRMFLRAISFNQPIGTWNTQNVTNMAYMFLNATAFNQPIGNWNTQSLKDIYGMFSGASAFNQPIGNWNTRNITDMSDMFYFATSFNQSLANWDVTNLIDGGAHDMLGACGLSIANYDATLIGWAAQDVKSGVILDAYELKYCAGLTARNTLINKGWVIQYDTLDCGFSVSGNVYADMNANCTKEVGEINLKSLVAKITPGDFYGMTNSNGDYKINVRTVGTYQVELLPQSPTGATNTILAVCPPKSVAISAGTPNVTNIDFGAKGKICSQLSVAVTVDRFRRCFEGHTYISYKNVGLIAANNVVVTVELPADIEAVSSVPAWTSQVGNILIYNLNTVEGQSEGAIKLLHKVSCANESIRNTARCIKATISPATYCTPLVSPTWDNADLTASSICIAGKLGRFTIKNVGTGNMTDSSNYRFFFDNVIVRTGRVKLQSNEETAIEINNAAQMVRIEVEQTPQHPTGVAAMTFLNRCGSVALPSDPIQALPKLDNFNTGSACVTITDSYDPNDKQIMPAGVTAQNIVEKDKELEFQIRFQNEGNDDAYKVVVRDTLDPNLDLATIRTISTSHASTVSMEGAGRGVVIWTFDNINLPAKSVNEAASIGMITFRIRMKPNLPVGTVIKNKGHIYFDFNSAIITNETVIKIGSLPTDFGNPANDNTIFPCPANPSVAVAGANQNISTTNTTLAATPVVKGYGKWSVIQGTATFSDEFSPTATVTNLSFGLNILEWTTYLCNATSSSRVEIFACPTISLTPNNLNNGTVSSVYSQTITQTGGNGEITYSISTGTLPNGLTLNTNTGEISGTPSVVNTFNFTVQAKDVNNCVGTKAYSVVIAVPPCPTISLTPNNLNNGTVGINYSQTITQTGGNGAITYSISAGTLPNGLTLNASTGEISGTPSVANTFNFTVQAKDVNNCIGTKAYSVVIAVPPCPTISFTPNNLNNGTVGTNYSQTITQTGGVGAINYSISAGTLPNGLTLNTNTGEISGTPSVANTFNFTVQAKDVNNCVGTKAYSVVIEVPPCPTISLTPNNLNNGIFGTNYSQTITQTGGVGAITYSISAGSLPTGLTLNGATGEISGTPTVANTFNFTVQAKDVNNCVGTKVYTVVVTSAPVPPPPPTLLTQSINFETIADKLYGDTDFQLVARATSNLPVSFELVSGNVVLFGNVVRILGVGSVTIRATQKGNNLYSAATPVLRTFTVNKASQTLTFNAIDDRIWNSGNFNLIASASSSLPIVYEVTAGQNIAKVTGTTVELLPAVGTVTIAARQIGNENYTANAVSRTFNVLKVPQNQHIITVNNLPSQVSYHNKASFSASANSNLPVKVEVIEGSVVISGNQLEFSKASAVRLRFTQEGNELWEAAKSVERTIIVNKLPQNIQATVPNELTIESLGTIVAQASSGLPVSLQLLSGKATLNGLNITPTGGSSIEIELRQAGNENYEAAPILRFVIGVKPILQIKNIVSTGICADNSLSFDYEIKGELTVTNQFTYFLSDTKGDFTNYQVLEGFMNPQTKKVSVRLPLVQGSNQYRIKIAATSPKIESNILQFTVNDLPNKPLIRQEGEFLVVNTQDVVQWYHAGLPIQQTGNKYKPTVEQLEKKNEFYVVVQNDKGCVATSEIFRNYVKPVPTGVNDEELAAKMLFYPNPTQDDLTISLSLENMKEVNLQLVDVMGRTVFENKLTVNDDEFSHTISLQDYSSGVYLLFVKVNDRIAVKKIVKQ